jgi:integrase
MTTVAICTGLRMSEILALRWSRVDFERVSENGELQEDPEFANRLLT